MIIEDILIRITLACVVGGLIGYERKISGKPAGITTHLVVCLGATVVTMIQRQIDMDILKMAKENPEYINILKTDVSRIPAQIVSGVGFLGGGVILHSKTSISGVTTAATIWITACLGIGIGFGYYTIVIPTTLILILLLNILKRHGVFSDSDELLEDIRKIIGP